MSECYVIDSGLSTSLLLLATLIIMFYIYITLLKVIQNYSDEWGMCKVSGCTIETD